MTKVLRIAAAVFVVAATIPADANEPSGTWLIQDGTAKVRIVSCGEALCGSVVWLAQPIDATTGMPLMDKLNADPQKRNRPVLGLPVVIGMQRAGENSQWRGQLYNPDDGNTYRGSIEVVDGTRLRVRGCMAIFCQTEIWTRSK